MNCNYKVKIKDIQNKYQFKIFCKTYDDTEIQGDIETLNSEVEALQEENLYLNSLVEQAFDKKEVEGEELSIDDTINAKMEVELEGNTTQKTTTGKQLINNIRAGETVTTLNGVTFTTNEDGSIKANGTATSDFAFITCDQSQTQIRQNLLNKSLILTGCPTGGSNTTYFIQCFGYGGATVVDTGNGTSAFNFTNESGNWNVAIMIKNGTACNNLIFKPMIRLSSITDNTYEKYTGGIASPNPSYPSNVNVVTGDNTIVVSNKNFISVQPTPYNATAQYSPLFSTDIIANLKKGKTYTLSFDTENTGINCYFQQTTGISLTYKAFTCDGTRKYVTFTTTQDLTTISKVIVSRNSATSTTGTGNCTNVMIEQSSTAKPYEEHQEQTFQINLGNIELCKIGDYQDYFYKSNNKWYKHSEIGKAVLDGSENWYKTNDTSASVFVLANAITTKSYGSSGIALSSHFKYQFANTAGKFYFGTATNIALCMDTTYDLAGFKTWIGTNNVTLYYILNTPTDTEITDTTLISQLEALKTAMSYAEQTNISQINNDTPFILQVTALASYNSRIVALENAILNANRNVAVENTRKSNEVIEEPKEEVVDDNKDKNIIKEEK